MIRALTIPEGAAPEKREPAELLPCPFCGDAPEVEPWHGGGPNKHMVGCVNDNCSAQPDVAGATRAKAIAAWNRRTPA